MPYDFAVDLWQFMLKVVSNWAALVTGGVVALAFIVYEKLKGPISRKAAVYGLIAFLFTSFFLTWRKEHKDVRDMNRLLADLRQQVDQLQLQVREKCPPDNIVAYWYDWFRVSVYTRKSVPEHVTQPEFGKPPVAVKFYVEDGSIRFLDTGETPTSFRGHRVSTGGHIWVCGPQIAKAKFVGAREPPNDAIVQVTAYRAAD